MRRLEETKLSKADRVVGVTCYIFIFQYFVWDVLNSSGNIVTFKFWETQLQFESTYREESPFSAWAFSKIESVIPPLFFEIWTNDFQILTTLTVLFLKKNKKVGIQKRLIKVMAWRHLLWRHNLTFAVNYIVKNMEICPLFTCKFRDEIFIIFEVMLKSKLASS